MGIAKSKNNIIEYMHQQTIGFTAARAKDGIQESSIMRDKILKNTSLEDEIKQSTKLPARGIMNCQKNTLCANKFSENYFHDIIIRIKYIQN